MVERGTADRPVPFDSNLHMTVNDVATYLSKELKKHISPDFMNEADYKDEWKSYTEQRDGKYTNMWWSVCKDKLPDILNWMDGKTNKVGTKLTQEDKQMSLEDTAKAVKGIGPKTVERMKKAGITHVVVKS